MLVQEIHTDKLEKYRKFTQEAGSVFNSYAWKEQVHGDNMRLYGIYEDDGQLTGAFHLYFEKRAGMSFIKNPPYVPHIGLIYHNKSANPSNALSAEKKVTELLCDHLASLSPAVLSIALPPEIIDTQFFFWKKYKVIPNYTYRINLSPADDSVEQRFSAEHRNSMKKALKDNVKAELCTDYNIVKQLVLNTFNRKKESVNEANIDAILFKLANSANSFAYVASSEGKSIAASFCLYDKNGCYYLLGGYDSASRHQGAGILCVYNSILRAQQLGLTYFDFEGSMIREVERYFRGFGPELVPYYTINKAKLPLELILKFIKRELF